MTSSNIKQSWATDGIATVRKLWPPDDVDRLARACERILTQWRMLNPENGDPGGGPDAHVMRHLNHPGYFEDHDDERILMLEAIASSVAIGFAEDILQTDVLFRCTSLFFNPHETSVDGNWHRDSQFHAPDENDEKQLIAERAHPGTSVQMQIALIPSDDIEFVPGSHQRWDTDDEYAIRRAGEGANNRSKDMPDALRIALQPGDAVAFNPFGLHRGRYHTDKPRLTLMLTYTACTHPRFDYFSNQPWFDEPGYLVLPFGNTMTNGTRTHRSPRVGVFEKSSREASVAADRAPYREARDQQHTSPYL